MDSLTSILTQYYGMDFVSAVCGITSIYLLGSQKKTGFLFGIVALISGGIVMAMAQSIPFIINNIILIILNVRGFMKWSRENRKAE